MYNSSARQFPSRRAPTHLPIYDRGNRPNIIYLTVCTWNRRPILANHAMYDLLIEMWKKAHTWLVGRFVILPNHVHLFCAPADVVHPPLAVRVSYWKRLTTIARRKADPTFSGGKSTFGIHNFDQGTATEPSGRTSIRIPSATDW
jgi:REP element-mobilizing transposase RayT